VPRCQTPDDQRDTTLPLRTIVSTRLASFLRPAALGMGEKGTRDTKRGGEGALAEVSAAEKRKHRG